MKQLNAVGMGQIKFYLKLDEIQNCFHEHVHFHLSILFSQ